MKDPHVATEECEAGTGGRTPLQEEGQPSVRSVASLTPSVLRIATDLDLGHPTYKQEHDENSPMALSGQGESTSCNRLHINLFPCRIRDGQFVLPRLSYGIYH